MSTILFFLPFLLLFTVLAVYAERKVSAFIQDRYGPMEVGYYGILQTVADLLKLLQKEDIVPRAADRKLFLTAPVLIFVFLFAGFAVLPVTSSWQGAPVQTGVFYLLAIVSLDVIGIIMAGWGSNNKYALLGAMRSAAQIISYEVPLTLSVLSAVVICQTLDLQEISLQQGIWSNEINYLFGIKALGIDVTSIGGFLTWNVVRMPLLFFAWLIFFISSLAESNRAPFDLPEAESELVAGFQTEYSGFRWSVIMLAEYGMMLLVSFLGVILFFGSWNTPLPNIGPVMLAEWTTGEPGTLYGTLWSAFWLIGKAMTVVLIQMWVRWTYPRVRIDQLMTLGWKYLTPAALVILLLSGIWRLLMI
ncbi:NADH-ubiquinone oxidoreductase chain H [Fulvivirga imtechensis AK7]|uniref:NADH-quinone oxidoreductase subunit H n=1 Tax=Fulvivirga imtechensis AK7 TaxID=1237149 RepID=L8JNV6_9BACT|nr:complex I subunit 1 family protein [Fulvivirga imtechensis]ELR70525.1 NADH-ubiquinone oxidoreductase chain H [Fulvivirga imtechensis AK7]